MRTGYGAVIVPTLLSNEESGTKLKLTISEIPPSLNCQVVAVIQGDTRNRERHINISDQRKHIVVDAEPRGKWPAIWEGLSRVDSDAEWVAVFDGDAAFSGEGLAAIVEVLVGRGAEHVVGQRSAPMLSSVDDLSGNTRVFIEAYFNTLVLVSLGRQLLDQYRGFDIQCGLQGFAHAWLRVLTRRQMPFYGGEALLFHESVKAGIRVGCAPVSQRAKSQSSYRAQEIVRQLLELDFMKGIPIKTFESGVDLAADVYDKWIPDPPAFRHEIEQLVLPVIRRGAPDHKRDAQSADRRK